MGRQIVSLPNLHRPWPLPLSQPLLDFRPHFQSPCLHPSQAGDNAQIAAIGAAQTANRANRSGIRTPLTEYIATLVTNKPDSPLRNPQPPYTHRQQYFIYLNADLNRIVLRNRKLTEANSDVLRKAIVT